MAKYRIVHDKQKNCFFIQRSFLKIWFSMFWYYKSISTHTPSQWHRRQFTAYSDAAEFVTDLVTPKFRTVSVISS